MPSAVVVTNHTEKFDLKTLSGAWVELRILTYGETLAHRDSAMNLAIQGDNRKDLSMTMAVAQERVALMEFKSCIVDHNLEDDAGTKLNMSNPADVKRLHPKVGAEISALIGKLNNFEDELEDLVQS